MKRVLKIAGAFLSLVLVAVGAFAGYIASDWPVHYSVVPVELSVAPTPERLARGKQLVGIRCAGCHFDQKTGALTGIQMLDAPSEFGPMFSHNITKHGTIGAGRYSDGDLVRLLRTGVRRDGVFSGPFMQSPHLADEDLSSIIAFLRSDDPWVEAKDTADRQWQPTFLAKLLMHVAFKPLEMPKAPIPVPPLSDKIAYGRYVAHGLGDCFACHSADFKTMNVLEPEKSEGYMGGGNAMRDAAGNPIFTANITMDEETGIGAWTEEQFVRAVRTGVRPDGRPLRYPMITFDELSEAEVSAAYAYLKTVPVIKKKVERNFQQFDAPGVASVGEKTYNKYGCFSCHGKAGAGVCDMRNASKSYDTDEKLNAFLHDPSQFVPGTQMPKWGGIIPEDEFPGLIQYVHELEKHAAK